MGNGTVFSGGISAGPSGTTDCACPTAQTELPWGIVDSRAMLASAAGSVVAGMLSHTPGSMCSAPPVVASVTRCRYVTP